MDLKNRVEQIAATIGELREAAGDGPKTRQLLDSLFRTVHSFKAAASAAGSTNQSRTAHEFENLLHSLRTGRLTLDDTVLRTFDDTVLALRSESENFSLNRLNELAKADVGASFELTEFPTLKDAERHRATAALEEGANLYVMETTFDATNFDERFRQLKEQLDAAAEVISTSVTLENDSVKFRVLYAAQAEQIRVQELFQQAILAGRTFAATLGKHVEFVTLGDEFLVDGSWRDVLEDALLHLVRNAVDHGIESSGRVTFQLLKSPNETRILVTDNGRGIDPANLSSVFEAGFSTAKAVSEISGRGVGLDAVKTAIEAAGGTIEVISYVGKFTTFVIRMPNPSSDA